MTVPGLLKMGPTALGTKYYLRSTFSVPINEVHYPSQDLKKFMSVFNLGHFISKQLSSSGNVFC